MTRNKQIRTALTETKRWSHFPVGVDYFVQNKKQGLKLLRGAVRQKCW